MRSRAGARVAQRVCCHRSREKHSACDQIRSRYRSLRRSIAVSSTNATARRSFPKKLMASLLRTTLFHEIHQDRRNPYSRISLFQINVSQLHLGPGVPLPRNPEWCYLSSTNFSQLHLGPELKPTVHSDRCMVYLQCCDACAKTTEAGALIMRSILA